MDLNTLLTMFISFTVEFIVAAVMLMKHRLTFRFKPYISIPVGLLIASTGAVVNIICSQRSACSCSRGGR